MTKLSVNINKIATLRNARGGNNPDVVQVAMDCERFGAQGITIHPRPDERHIRKQDVYELKPIVKTEFNIEGYPDERFMNMVLELKPQQATLVPDPPGVLTSNAGWDLKLNRNFLQEINGRLREGGIRSSVFIDPDPEEAVYAKETGSDRVELYTESYAKAYKKDRDEAIKPFIATAEVISDLGMGINAGHDLDLENLRFFNENIPYLLEVSIGHALICDALYLGLENTIALYLRELRN